MELLMRVRVATFLRWLPALLALALLWLGRDAPLQPLPGVWLDGLSSYLLLLGAIGFACQPHQPRWRSIATALVFLLGLGSSALPLMLAAFIGLALLSLPRWQQGTAELEPGAWLARLLQRAPLPLAALCLGIGYGTLMQRGIFFFDQATAGAALNSVLFWFVLLAAIIPLVFIPKHQPTALDLALRMLWFYPLVRLYSLGPWNSGWSLATIMLGIALALWLAWRALRSADSANSWDCFLALALAGFGLSSSVGLAAGMYCLLVALLLVMGNTTLRNVTPRFSRFPLLAAVNAEVARLTPWLLSPAFPLAAPFVAIWMLVGSAVAGGIVAFAVTIWLVALLLSLRALLHSFAAEPAAPWPGLLSLGAGIGAPLIFLLLIHPAIQHLQGGMTAFGDLTIWPWVGLASLNAAKTQTAVLPSLAVAGLMGVLLALVYLLRRLWATAAPSDGSEPPSAAALLHELRRDVPWLGSSDEGESRDRG